MLTRAYPRRELHVVVANYRTHKHPEVEAWLARHPRITVSPGEGGERDSRDGEPGIGNTALVRRFLAGAAPHRLLELLVSSGLGCPSLVEE